MTLSASASEPKPAIGSERAIENLIVRYSHAVDRGDFKAVGTLFAHGRIDNSVSLLEGSAAVEGMLHHTLRLYPDGTPRTSHVTTNLLIRVDETAGTASATSYITIMQAEPDSSFPLQTIFSGRYQDRFHRLQGEWHFLERALVPTLMGDLSRNATAASGFVQSEPSKA
jgi:hypothetical protein